MCVICLTKQRLTKQEFHEFWVTNGGDGYGVAWSTVDGAEFAKGPLSCKKAWAHYNDTPIPNGQEHVVHFRAATSGGRHPELCHPFPVGYSRAVCGTAPAVLFHNGVLTDWSQLAVQAALLHPEMLQHPFSDTTVAAILVERAGTAVLPLLECQYNVSKWCVVDKHGIHTIGTFYRAGHLRVSNTWAFPGADITDDRDPYWRQNLEDDVEQYDQEMLRYGLSEAARKDALYHEFGEDLYEVRDR